MRISADPDDPGYFLFRSMLRPGVSVRIYLDGQLVSQVITADNKRRTIVTYCRDANGHFIRRSHGHALSQQQTGGNVEVRFIRDPYLSGVRE